MQQNSKHKGLQRPWSTEWKTIMSNNTNRNDEEIENEWHSGGDVNINPLCWAESCHFFWCRYCSPCLPFLQQVSHQICDKDQQASEISKKIKKGWQFRTLHCNHLPRNQRCRGGSPTCRNRDEHDTSPKLNFFPISAIGNNFLDSSWLTHIQH